MIAVYIAAGIVGIILFGIIGIYNSFKVKQNNVENALSGIDVMLKKRHDLIPNLIETVKQYMTHEKDLLTDITKLREQLVNNSPDGAEKINLENQLSSKLQGLNVSVENYPDLKANQNFLQLQGSMNEVESQLSAARRTYNANVLSYNNAQDVFPSNIIAGMMNLEPTAFFEIPETERQNVDVKSLF